MRKILVSDTCEGCGYCFLESPVLQRLPSGKASPAEGGFFTDEQHELVMKMCEICPAGALSAIDDGTEVMPNPTRPSNISTLKKYIDDQLLSFSVKKPSHAELKFDPNDYVVPFNSVRVLSDFEYSNKYKWDRGAAGAGITAFEETIYSQRKTLVKKMVAIYKKEKLEKFLCLTHDDVNAKVSSILLEIRVLAEDITKGAIVLPADFATLESGPECDYNGKTLCENLRALEAQDYCESFFPATDYSCYIDTEDNGDKERYDLRKSMRVFADDLKRQLSSDLDAVVMELMQKTLKQFETGVRKTIAAKVEILKAELKKCTAHAPKDNELENGNERKAPTISDEIADLLEKLNNIRLIKMPPVRKRIGRLFDSSYRFSSQSQCREAAINRLTRYCSECESYLSPNCSENISGDLSENYQTQSKRKKYRHLDKSQLATAFILQ